MIFSCRGLFEKREGRDMYSPDGAHQRLLAQKLPLSFDGTQDFAAHQAQIKEKLTELLGERPERVPLDPIVEETVEHEEYTERRISFAVEQDVCDGDPLESLKYSVEYLKGV